MKDENEVEQELTPEEEEAERIKKAKLKDISRRSKLLGVEATELISSDEDKQKWEERYRKIFKRDGVPFILSGIRNFQAGLEFGLWLCHEFEESEAIKADMHLELIKNRMEKDVKDKLKDL